MSVLVRFAVASGALATFAVLAAACGWHHASTDKADAASNGGAAGEGGSGGLMLGGNPSVPTCGTEVCPLQSGTSVCCASANGCGYVGSVSGPCVPSVSGGRALTVVDYPNGALCPAQPCASGTGCPTAMPAVGSACSGAGPCNYCFAGDLSRSYECKSGIWADLGVSDCYSEIMTR